jgi:putative transposase
VGEEARQYASDVSDEQWALIEPHTGRPDARGAVRRHAMRQIINAILYQNKTGCQWRLLPKDFPPWFTVYNHFWRMRERGVWKKITLDLNEKRRKKTATLPRPRPSSSTRKRSKPTTKAQRGASTAAKKSKGAAAQSP